MLLEFGMLIELFERLLGYDKWPETSARFETSELEKTAHADRYGNISYTWASVDTIVWTDKMGSTHTADFKVPDDSPIYQMIDGDTVTIRYNPAKPERFYYRELLETRIYTSLKYTLLTLLGLVLLLAFVELHIWLSK